MGEKNIQPQTTNKKLDFHKVFAAIGIILIVMIIVVGGIWYFVQSAEDKVPVDDDITVTKIATNSAKKTTESAKEDETVDWITATSVEAGYKIKYPPTWLETKATFFAPSKDLLGISDSGFGGLISIALTGSPYNISKEIELYKEHNFTNYSQIDTKVDGKVAVKLSGISQMENEAISFKGTKFIVYLVEKGEGTLIISYHQSPTWSDYSKEFELMVSTFKFI